MSTIKIEKKSQLVKEVFDSVASRYDTMNDIMSLGMHRLWKDKMVNSVHFTKNSNGRMQKNLKEVNKPLLDKITEKCMQKHKLALKTSYKPPISLKKL